MTACGDNRPQEADKRFLHFYIVTPGRNEAKRNVDPGTQQLTGLRRAHLTATIELKSDPTQ